MGMPTGRLLRHRGTPRPRAYPTSNQTSGVACPRILRCTRCRKTRTRACSRSVTSPMPEAACSTLARRPSLISPQVSRWRRRPPDQAMTVSIRSGESPATFAPRSARAPGAGSRSRPAAARRPPRRARAAAARRSAPPSLEGAPVCSPHGSGRARSRPTTAPDYRVPARKYRVTQPSTTSAARGRNAGSTRSATGRSWTSGPPDSSADGLEGTGGPRRPAITSSCRRCSCPPPRSRRPWICRADGQGLMFWLTRNRLSGSHFRLTSTSRA